MVKVREESEGGISSLWMVSGRGGVIFEREGISDRGYYTTAAPLVHRNSCQSNRLGTALFPNEWAVSLSNSSCLVNAPSRTRAARGCASSRGPFVQQLQ